MSSILLFIVLAVTGGLIAYVGDNIGRKVGRKHWSLFSLRPRHTGTIVTTVCGIVMIGAVMGILYGLSPEFRAAVNNEAAEWRHKFDLVASQAVQDKISLARQKAELQRLAAHNGELRTEQDRVQSQLRVVQRQLEARQARLQQAQKALEERQQRLANLRNQERALQGRIALLNRENRQLNASQRTLNQEITRLVLTVHAVKNAPLAVRAGEILLNAEAAGSQSAPRSQQLIAKVLSILEKQSQARVVRGKISIPGSDVEAAVKALLQPGHYLIRITAANNARPSDPLSIRLSVWRQPAPSVDIASDILERDRLQGSRLQERLAQQRPPAADEQSGSAVALSSEDRKNLLEVIQQLSRATAPGAVQSKVLNDPDLGGPLHLRLDSSNAPQ